MAKFLTAATFTFSAISFSISALSTAVYAAAFIIKSIFKFLKNH